MKPWEYTLDIKDAWKQCKQDEITVQQLSAHIAGKLKLLSIKNNDDDYDKLNFIDDFEEYSKDPDMTKDDFDCLWEALYNWADSARVWLCII